MFSMIFNYCIHAKENFHYLVYDKVSEKIILIFVIKYKDIRVFFFFFTIQKTLRFLYRKRFFLTFHLFEIIITRK